MRIFLILNGPDGWQTGIEDGFNYLKSTGEIDEVSFFYFEGYISKLGITATLKMILDIANEFMPNIVIIFHISRQPITDDFLASLKSVSSKPALVYDEHDMYGTWAKPVTKTMKKVMQQVDVVSICGLGSFYRHVEKFNHNLIYTPHHADIARFDKEPYILSTRKNKLILIGNKVKPRLFTWLRRLPGAREREKFIKSMSNTYLKEFILYGNGWDQIVGNQGPIDFQKQLDVYRDSWVTLAYEHYPKIPYYFSNRLPIALLAGSLYVCHYHEGYENIFKNCDFIFFFKNNQEAIDIINYIFSLDKDDLLERSAHARSFALKYFHPNVVWRNFLYNVLGMIAKKNE